MTYEANREDDPRNALLGVFRQTISAFKEMGMEPQIRAIVDAELPRQAPYPDLFKPPPAQVSQSAPIDTGDFDEIEMVALIGDIKRLEKHKMSGLAHASLQRVRVFVERIVRQLKADRSSPQETKAA